MRTHGVPGSFLSLWKEHGSEAILVIVSINPREPLTLEMISLLTLLTLGAHAQRGLRYLVCPSVCVCVCLSVYLNSRAAGNKAAREWYTCLLRNKHSKNNAADLAKTAAFWLEKLASPWTMFHDPTHQLVRCACVFITPLGAYSTTGTTLPGVLHCCKATSSAASLF